MRRILFGCIAVLGTAAFLLFTLGSSNGASGRTYRIELDNAYDLTKGGEFKVAGVNAGTIKSIGLDTKTLHAVVTVQITQSGFGQFHHDAYCQSRPQSLIGEYFIDCQPGNSGPVLRSGATIPADHTQSTIPADLVQNIMRLPYRQRFTLIINELGAAVAGRSEDLQTALRRADPALAETDNLLNLLANDAQTIKSLNTNANTVITALARNKTQVQRFIQYANRASTDSATQANNITLTWQRLPGFLQQLRPTLAKLGAAADAQDPVLVNLHAAAGNLNKFFHLLVPFSRESLPSLRSLGQASITGRSAVKAATPTIKDLSQFTKGTPDLAKNLAIVLGDLNKRSRAAEPDPRSPDGGKGFTGLEALLQYVYNITEAVDYFGPNGHMLGVDAFANSACSPYQTPQMLANAIASYKGNLNTYSPTNPRSCYAFMGPNQPGVTTTDPSWNAKDATPANPSRCVPDPGGFPVEPPQFHVHYHGTSTSACKLKASSPGPSSDHSGSAANANGVGASGGGTGAGAGSTSPSGSSPSSPVPSLGSVLQTLFGGVQSTASQTTTTAKKTIKKTVHKAAATVHQAGSGIGGAAANTAGGATGGTGTTGTGTGTTGTSTTGQTQQLLNYLLAP
jgi:virulence factor Mce-like protein